MSDELIGGRWKPGYHVASRGLEGCTDPRCTRTKREDGTWECIGWHCPVCLAPTSSQGHRCPDRGET